MTTQQQQASSSPSPASSPDDYCRDYLPGSVVEKLQAGAFRSLCTHLQERSDEVQNLELMSLSGFCRNCLAKWMVLEARRLVGDSSPDNNEDPLQQALNAFGYEEAAQHVYGMTYGEWKKRHQKKATEEQMERFNASKPLQAVHDKAVLATRAEKPKEPLFKKKAQQAADDTQSGRKANDALVSSVCCQDVEEIAASKDKDPACNHKATAVPARDTRTIPPFQPPPLPSMKKAVKVGILTVSDRAFKHEYETGDLSGPAVAKAAKEVTPNLETCFAIVPDDTDAIQSQIRSWCDNNETKFDLILTTGGTGMSPRDVTPEATRGVLDQECNGLMCFCTTECSHLQPLASLSRGTAGIRKNTIIANLPGNPRGVAELVPVLLPLLLHAVCDVKAEA